MCVCTHKTKTPYKGPSYDLHQAAWNWLNKHRFFSKQGINWKKEQVHFEPTKEKKVEKIMKLGCTHYIDDLTDILKMIGGDVQKYWYTKKPKKKTEGERFKTINRWEEILIDFDPETRG